MKEKIDNHLKKFILIKEDRKNFYLKAITGPSKVTKLPKKINEEMSYYIGLIIGDGHINKSKKRVIIELTNLKLIKEIKNLTTKLFNITPKLHKIIDKRPNRKVRYLLRMDNSVIHTFLNKIIKIPKGNKSKIVKIPDLIKKGDIGNKKAILLGLLTSDGGKRHRDQIGLSTASKTLREDIETILDEIKIRYYCDKWVNKKYNKEYFGISFKRKELNRLMRRCRSGQTGQFVALFLEKLRD